MWRPEAGPSPGWRRPLTPEFRRGWRRPLTPEFRRDVARRPMRRWVACSSPAGSQQMQLGSGFWTDVVLTLDNYTVER